MAGVINGFRWVFTGVAAPPASALAMSFISAAVLKSIAGDSPVYDLERTPRGQRQSSGPVQPVRLEMESGEQTVCDDRPPRFLATIRSNEAVSGLRLLLTIVHENDAAVGTVPGPDLGAFGAGDIATYRIEIPELPLAPDCITALWL